MEDRCYLQLRVSTRIKVVHVSFVLPLIALLTNFLLKATFGLPFVVTVTFLSTWDA